MAKFDPFLSFPHILHSGAIQGNEGIKFCHLATLNPITVRELRPPHHGDVERVGRADGDERHEAADERRQRLKIKSKGLLGY